MKCKLWARVGIEVEYNEYVNSKEWTGKITTKHFETGNV
jgi:hypothetical protein